MRKLHELLSIVINSIGFPVNTKIDNVLPASICFTNEQCAKGHLCYFKTPRCNILLQINQASMILNCCRLPSSMQGAAKCRFFALGRKYNQEWSTSRNMSLSICFVLGHVHRLCVPPERITLGLPIYLVRPYDGFHPNMTDR
jgi:hypothetical protein